MKRRVSSLGGPARHAHPTIDATLDAKAQGLLAGEILVETYGDAISFCDRPDPVSIIDAKFSLQHCVAIVAERGEPALADFEPDAIAALAPCRATVRVSENADITVRYPDHYGARISAADGAVTLIDTRGDPERPLSQQGIVDKARALFSWGGLSEAEAEQAIVLALQGDDPDAICTMLGDWLA